MSEINHYQLMAAYNRWMNEKLYALCADLPDEERRADRGAFFRSIHGTLNHLLYADKMWMGRFVQVPFTGGKIGEDLYPDFSQMRQERERMDTWIIDWTRELEPSWLEAPFSFVSGVDGKTRIAAAWTLVTHLFNHQTHHRGQLTTLLKQAGIDPGITDIPWLPESGTVTLD